MSFVTIPGLVKAEAAEPAIEAAEVQVPSNQVPEGVPVHDVVIVGSGPAGYTAAVYTARAGLAPIVLAGQLAAGGALMNTTEVENFPGFPEGIQGPALMDNMREQAEKFGADIRYEDVIAVNLEGDVKAVATEDEVFYARAVILATGSEYRHMNVPGEDEFSGRGVSYCATCDGFFFKDRRLAVIGGGDSAMEEATFLTNFASEVVVVHRRDALRASRVMAERALNNPKISFEWNATVDEVLGDEAVTGLRLASTVDGSTREIAVDGVFVAIGHLPRTGFLRGQVAPTRPATSRSTSRRRAHPSRACSPAATPWTTRTARPSRRPAPAAARPWTRSVGWPLWATRRDLLPHCSRRCERWRAPASYLPMRVGGDARAVLRALPGRRGGSDRRGAHAVALHGLRVARRGLPVPHVAPAHAPCSPILGGGNAVDGSADSRGRGRGSFRRGGHRDVCGLVAGHGNRRHRADARAFALLAPGWALDVRVRRQRLTLR